MKKCIFIVFWAAFMILKSDGSTGDLFLDSIHGTNDSKFGATLSETHISNNNGIQEQHGSSITYGQKSDGSCVERVKSSKNGETKVTELPVECEKVQAEIQKNNEKTQQAIEEQARKLLEEHEKMMEEHWGAEKDEKSEPGKDLEMVHLDTSSGSNIILDSLGEPKDEQWSAHAMESHHSNNNGIEDNYKSYSAVEQRPDGSCVKKVMESRNGREEVNEYPMDCERAKMEVKENNKQTQQAVEAHSRKIDEYHRKMMEEHRRQIDEQIKMMEEHTRKINEQHRKMIEEQRQATKQIQDRIKASFNHLFKTDKF